jgi:hypothetical protein
MTVRFQVHLFLFLISSSAAAQLSLKNPQICHDKDKYLRCYNDGSYSLTFTKGNFKEFRTADNSIRYSDVDRTITMICVTGSNGKEMTDTIQIVQLHKSILLKKGSLQSEITSLKDLPKDIWTYGAVYFKEDNVVRGLIFSTVYKNVKLNLWDFSEGWNWKIIVMDHRSRLVVDYNVFKKNRVQSIFITDDSLRYGMSISTSLRSSKKLALLHSLYVDTLWTTEKGIPAIGVIPLDKSYRYEYNKTGRLRLKGIVGELKLCDCE